ncbi:MAG: MFS transporter [Sporichthya sp.]|nr:MFS transporter [Sporichthya sp.]
MATALVSPVIAVIRDDLGLSGTAAGLLLTAHCLVIALASPLAGILIDRHGVRRPLAAGLVLYGLAGGAGMFTDSYGTLLASRVLFGLGAALVFTGSTVGLLNLYRGAAQDRVMGWRTSATATGALTWPLLGGALGTWSWHAPFGVYLLGVVVGVAAVRELPDDRPEHRPAAGTRAALAVVRRSPAMLGYYGLFASSSVLLYALVVFLPLRFDELGVTDTFHVAVLGLGLSVTMIATGFAYARIRTRLGHRGVLRVTYATWTVSFLLLAGTEHVAFVVAASTLFGVGMGMSLPALTVLLGDASPPHLRGALTALSGTALFLGQFGSPLLLGPVADRTSLTAGFLGAAGLAAAILLALSRRPEPIPD